MQQLEFRISALRPLGLWALGSSPGEGVEALRELPNRPLQRSPRETCSLPGAELGAWGFGVYPVEAFGHGDLGLFQGLDSGVWSQFGAVCGMASVDGKVKPVC